MNAPVILSVDEAPPAHLAADAAGLVDRLSAWRDALAADLAFIVDVADSVVECAAAKDMPQVDLCHEDVLAIAQRSAFKARVLFENDCRERCSVVSWVLVAPVFVAGRLSKILGFCGLSAPRERKIAVPELTLIDTFAHWLGAHLLRTASDERVYADLDSVRAILDATSEAVFALDDADQVVFANAAAERLAGLHLAHMRGKPVESVLELNDNGEVVSLSDLAALVVATGSPLTLEARAVSSRRSTSIRVEGRVLPARSVASGMISSIVALRDVEATADLQQQLVWQFSHDQLTGVTNRFEIESKIEAVFNDAGGQRVRAALVHFGVDGLEMVNSLCGTHGGDELLKRVAQLLQMQAGDAAENVARVGGDEFAVLLENCDLRAAKAFAEKVIKSMDGLFSWDGEEIAVTMSAGVVPLRMSSPTADDVLLASATALRLAKDFGRAEIRVMRSINDGVGNVSDVQTIGMIRRALDQNRLALLSQRIQPLPAARHKAMHHEILVRLRNEAGGLITPDRFIPAAERNHLMPLLDKAIVAAALQAVHRFPAEDVLSINLSGKTISYPGIDEFIREQMQAAQVDPARICFEITETAAISNEALAVEFIKKIKALGCMISLDDFGAGHHNFRFMREVAPEFIKIDGAFVREMFKDDGFDTAAIRSIVDVAQKINAEVIAESVEDQRTMDALTDMGVAFVQGWHIHRPQLIEGF